MQNHKLMRHPFGDDVFTLGKQSHFDPAPDRPGETHSNPLMRFL